MKAENGTLEEESPFGHHYLFGEARFYIEGISRIPMHQRPHPFGHAKKSVGKYSSQFWTAVWNGRCITHHRVLMEAADASEFVSRNPREMVDFSMKLWWFFCIGSLIEKHIMDTPIKCCLNKFTENIMFRYPRKLLNLDKSNKTDNPNLLTVFFWFPRSHQIAFPQHQIEHRATGSFF